MARHLHGGGKLNPFWNGTEDYIRREGCKEDFHLRKVVLFIDDSSWDSTYAFGRGEILPLFWRNNTSSKIRGEKGDFTSQKWRETMKGGENLPFFQKCVGITLVAAAKKLSF